MLNTQMKDIYGRGCAQTCENSEKHYESYKYKRDQIGIGIGSLSVAFSCVVMGELRNLCELH